MYCLLCTGHRFSHLIYCLLYTVYCLLFLKTVNSTKNNYITVRERERERERERAGRTQSIVSLFWLVCSLPVLCLVSVCLLFLVFCSFFSFGQSISTVVCSSQLYSEGGWASQPRSKQVREDNSLRGNHVYTYYVGE